MKASQKAWYEKNRLRILKERKNKYHADIETSRKDKREKYVLAKDRILAENKKWRDANKKEIKKKKELYNKTYKFRRNQKDKKRKLIDPLFKLKGNIRTLITGALKRKGFKKNTKTFNILGCDFETFKQYLESKFEPWMTWQNHGKYNGEFNFGWDIDHIENLSTAISEGDVVKLNHYTNLQPLCSKTNREIKR